MPKLELNDDLMNILSMELLSVSNTDTVCPMILGEPGIGKSSIVKHMCEKNDFHFYELLCNQLGDRTDLTGCRSVKEIVTASDGTQKEIWKQIFFPHQSLQDTITCAENNPDDIVVCFLDEINRTSSDITSAILSFITARTIGTYKFPENVRFIVAGNDTGNVTAIDSASISRFVRYNVKPNAQAWMDYENETDKLNPYIAQVLKANPDLIFCKSINIVSSTVQNDDGDDIESEYEAFNDAAEGFNQITTPRTLSGLNAMLNSMTLDKLTELTSKVFKDDETGEDISYLQTIIYGHVGITPFSLELCKIIAEDVSRGQMQKATNIVKPKLTPAYKALKKCKDRQTRDDMIRNMSDVDKSAVLLYAVWEDKDNTDLIKAVAQTYTSPLFMGDDQPQIANLKSHDELNVDNYAALLNTGTQLGDMMRRILGD